MNKKEILEIKKQFSHANCAITRICGCYVDFEKNKKLVSKSAFLSMPEEETFKYFKIFRQTLSGTVGKQLLNMEFPMEQEMAGGTQEFLLKLRDSKLQDDELTEQFYDKIIEYFPYAENYYIILIHGVYDVPGKAMDGMEMFDASDSVYEHILCSICPVNLSKAGLSYNMERNSIEDRVRDWIVEEPMKGFLFPAFHDRNSDIHSILYYSKKPEEIEPEFIEALLGADLPMTAEVQKESFQEVLADTLQEECSYEVIRSIHENMQEMIEDHKEDPQPLELSRQDVKKLLEHSGVSEQKMEDFDTKYETVVGEKNNLLASNIVDTNKFQIQTPDVIIKVNPERTQLIQTRIINGERCLVIPVENYIEVNGVNVNVLAESAESALEEI